jgi:hypothetical protein
LHIRARHAQVLTNAASPPLASPELPKISTKRQSLRNKKSGIYGQDRRPSERRAASDGNVSYAKRNNSSITQDSDLSLPETLDDVSDWARRHLEANRPPLKPVKSIPGQIVGSPLQQLNEAVSKFIAGPVPPYEEDTTLLLSSGVQKGTLPDIERTDSMTAAEESADSSSEFCSR